MDLSTWLGVLGIVVSVVVGWVTYWLAKKRSVSQHHQLAKATIIQEFSKSLGEDAVPSVEVLEACIRSVLLEVGDSKVALSVDEILDDLMRRVTSDPFLDDERRRKLQSDIQNVRVEAKKRQAEVERERLLYGEYDSWLPRLAPAVLSLVAALASLLVFAGGLLSGKNGSALRELFEQSDSGKSVALSVVATVAVLTSLIPALLDTSFLRRLFALWRRKR